MEDSKVGYGGRKKKIQTRGHNFIHTNSVLWLFNAVAL